MIPGTGIIRRLNFSGVEALMNFLEIIERAARINRMLVGESVNAQVTEAVHADQAIEQHMGIEAMQRIMIEVRMGENADIDRGDRKIPKVLIPGSRGMVAPGIDHHADAAR